MKSQSANVLKAEANGARLDAPGAWFRAYRLRHRLQGYGLSPERLGQEMNVHGMTIRRWEAGDGKPSGRDLECFARACDAFWRFLNLLSMNFTLKLSH
jgi:transcriptional regulator with XRE-family HTH domain